MKLYVITISHVHCNTIIEHAPIICLSPEKAEEEVKKIYNKRENERKERPDEQYDSGMYFKVNINELEVDNIVPKGAFGLNMVFGEEAVRCAREDGITNTIIQIDLQQIQGDYIEANFETERDRALAFEIGERMEACGPSIYEKSDPEPENIKDPFKEFFLMDEKYRKDITDSLLLESGTEVASGRTEDFSFSIVTQGRVRLVWKGEPYKSRSNFPDDLVEAIRSHTVQDNPDYYADENNWYELIIWQKKGTKHEILYSDFFEFDLSTTTEEVIKKDVLAQYKACK